MSFYARFAYVNRKDYEKPVVEGFLERQYIPNCCDMGYISDTTDTDWKDYPERNPDVYTRTYIQGRNNRNAELIFCADKDTIDRVYVKHYDENSDRYLEVSLLKYEYKDEESRDIFVFPNTIYDEIRSSVGDMDVYAEAGELLIAVRVHIFSDDEKLYKDMIAELYEWNSKLVESWRRSSVYKIADGDESAQKGLGDCQTEDGIKRYIDTPGDAAKFLSEFENRIAVLQKHAETDLRQVYQKMPIRKAKHITPRTLIEYSSSNSPKVNVLTTEEHFDIYEHRVLKQYLLDMQDFMKHRIRISQNKEKSYKEQIDGIEKNKEGVEASLKELRQTQKANEIKQQLEESKKKYGELIERERHLRKEWSALIQCIDEIVEKYPILQVKLRDEKKHSSMLFRRNRYYRSLYELIESCPMINVYNNVSAMPAQKLFTLYERWCYFKIVSIWIEKYGFEFYAFRTQQGVFDEEDKTVNDTLADILQNAVSDSPNPSCRYLGIILKRKDSAFDYVKLEYQRVFGTSDSLETGKKVIPDFCMTLGHLEYLNETTFDVEGRVYIMDSKFKKYNKKTILTEIEDVSLKKYIQKVYELSGVDVNGSYILHCDEKDTFIWGSDRINECYGKAMDPSGRKWDRKLGCFCLVPGNDVYISRLFRMILEWDAPYGYTDGMRCIVWRRCLLCGNTIGYDDIITGNTAGGYAKYHITCKGCGEFWVKSHCWKCNNKLIKHTWGHNYLREFQPWYIAPCPHCGAS
ncbi:MAG: hypothetical protein IKO61_00875 [Lachnospiraceae bacterium]|nr:hypothetical protein [Lachnospiraceae bacterium]